MNWKTRLIHLLLPAALLAACDDFQDDLAPAGENELDVADAITSLPNTSVFIDLKTRILSDEAVKFGLNVSPVYGEVSISDEAILEYKPNANFTSGVDFFSLDLVNASGAIIDTDSVYITMTNTADSLPCFNGALTDTYFLEMNQSMTIRPILNDGYCEESTSGAVMNIISDPEHGAISQTDLFTYTYTPEIDYVGADQLMYELTLIDDEGEEYYSIAMVRFTIFQEEEPTCDSAVVWIDSYVIDSVFQDSSTYYDIPVVTYDSVCSLTMDLAVVGVSSGEAFGVGNGVIRYYPGQDSVVTINYREDEWAIEGRTLTVYLSFVYEEVNCTLVTEAIDDSYAESFIEGDSLGTLTHPYYYDVLANDLLCEGQQTTFEIVGTDAPDSFHAFTSNANAIGIYLDESASGQVRGSVIYEVCTTNGGCDQAVLTFVRTND